jgi:hypothetical protein
MSIGIPPNNTCAPTVLVNDNAPTLPFNCTLFNVKLMVFWG